MFIDVILLSIPVQHRLSTWKFAIGKRLDSILIKRSIVAPPPFLVPSAAKAAGLMYPNELCGQ